MSTTWVIRGWTAKLAWGLLLSVGLHAQAAPSAQSLRSERPILEASLDEKNGSVNPQEAYPKPYHLFLNQRVGSKQPTSFTMHEDTGVRCVTAPCASDRRAEFIVKNIVTLRDGSIRYTARELNDTRVLQLVDHRFCISETDHDALWDVRVTSQEGEREFTGNPQPVPIVN